MDYYQAAFLAHMLIRQRQHSPDLSGDLERDDPFDLSVVGVVVVLTCVLVVLSAFIS